MLRIDGDKVKLGIIHRSWTMKAFAEKAGVTYQTVNRILRGKQATFRTTRKIASALGLDYSELIKQEESS